MEDKKSIVDDVFGKFHDIFGFYPESTGSYYLDAELIELHQGEISVRKVCDSHLLGRGTEGIPYVQQFMVYTV